MKNALYSFMLLFSINIAAQPLDSLRFISHEKIQTWIALGTDWQIKPKIHIYDYKKYPKHAIFLNNVLKQKVQFKDFRNLVNDPQKRLYVPFFIFDLRENPLKINEKSYDWAVRIEDYTFKDSPESLANLMCKVMDLLQKEMTFMHSKGILVIAEGGKNNYTMAKLQPFLKERKQAFCSLKAVYKLFE